MGFEVVNFVAATRRWYDKGNHKGEPERCRRTPRLPKSMFEGDCGDTVPYYIVL